MQFNPSINEAEKIVNEEEADDDDMMVSFADMQFNPEEDDVPDDAINSGKQFKILNSKLNSKMNSILHFLNDTFGKTFLVLRLNTS